MSTQTWHADRQLIEAYVAGGLDAVHAASVEQHLGRCSECRAAVQPLVDQHMLERAWSGIRDSVESPALPLPIRIARRCGVSEPTAKLLAATTSLRTSWVVSSLVALAFATIAVGVAGEDALAPFLLVAPMVPMVGVAAAYGSQHDPLETLVVTTPYGRTRLIMLRTLAVLVSVLPAAVLLGLFLPGPVWLAVAWLGPALTLVPVLMALASFVGPRNAAAAVAIAWSGAVLGTLRGFPSTWLLEPAQQSAYLLLAAAALGVLIVRARHDRRIGAVL
jgi:predicted anti-sigma-YlaC factor YlaD